MNFDSDIEQSLIPLRTGGLILYPTDTIWGIGCDATNDEAVKKVYELKQRSNQKSMVILVADEKSILDHVTQPGLKVFDYIKGITKPTTVIYEGAVGLAESVVAEDGTVAIRIVKDEFCKQLIKRFGKPIVSTSANISGYPPPVNFVDIDIAIKNGVEYIVQHRQEEMTQAQPSSIIKWNADGSLSILRP